MACEYGNEILQSPLVSSRKPARTQNYSLAEIAEDFGRQSVLCRDEVRWEFFLHMVWAIPAILFHPNKLFTDRYKNFAKIKFRVILARLHGNQTSRRRKKSIRRHIKKNPNSFSQRCFKSKNLMQILCPRAQGEPCPYRGKR
jgi:hypothetical protein